MKFDPCAGFDMPALFASIQEEEHLPTIVVPSEQFDALVRYERDRKPTNPRLVFRRDGAALIGDKWVMHPALLETAVW